QVRALVAQGRANRYRFQHAIEDVNTQVANLRASVATLNSQRATLELARNNLRRGGLCVAFCFPSLICIHPVLLYLFDPPPPSRPTTTRVIWIVTMGMVAPFRCHQWPACAPPSTCRVSPVTNVADSRYRTASTISWTSPIRPSGCRPARDACVSGAC